ncbi:hypothetical protein AGMMS50239_17400 [Bacteroidia bacterium]|nr:hypothetical protein AGMMS50239_17400 [Bacteroidia bacterium]
MKDKANPSGNENAFEGERLKLVRFSCTTSNELNSRPYLKSWATRKCNEQKQNMLMSIVFFNDFFNVAKNLRIKQKQCKCTYNFVVFIEKLYLCENFSKATDISMYKSLSFADSHFI